MPYANIRVSRATVSTKSEKRVNMSWLSAMNNPDGDFVSVNGMIDPNHRATARRNNWTAPKRDKVNTLDCKRILLEIALSKGLASRDDKTKEITMNVVNGVEVTVDCERCDGPLDAGNFQKLRDGSPAHKFACE